MDNFALQLKDLSPKQKVLGNLMFFVGLFGYLFFLGLSVTVMPYSTWRVLLPGFLATCAFVLLAVGFLQINSVLIWCGWVFAIVSTVLFLHSFEVWRIVKSYPMFVGCFAIASLLSVPFSVAKKMHCIVFVGFGAIAGLLFLSSFGLMHLWLILPIVCVCVLVVWVRYKL